MSELQPISYKARRYHAGSSNAEPVSIAVSDDEFHLTDSTGTKLVVPMHDISLKLGGSSSDRVVLELPQTGDTVIVNDLDFLKVVKKAQATSAITRQVKRAETARTINKLQGFVFLGVVLFSVFMFAGCLFVAVFLAPEKAAEDSAETKQSTEAPADSNVLKAENAYQQKVKGILLNAWALPSRNQYETVVVEIRLAKDGRVISTKIKESSKNKLFDDSAVEAVNSSSPLPAPPPHWTEPITLDFTFNPLDKTKED